MSQKSVDTLKRLKENMETGNLPLENFPQKDVLELIHNENQLWLSWAAGKLELYEKVYRADMDAAIRQGKKAVLLSKMQELIDDLERSPANLLGTEKRIKELEEAETFQQIAQYKEFARKIYDKYIPQLAVTEMPFTGKGVIYTVITGDYDVLREPTFIDENYDYICFTDNRQLVSPVWSIRYIEDEDNLDPIRLARKHKILCCDYLKEYDYSIYLDGKLQIKGDLRKMLTYYSKGSSMLCFPHHVRECAYKEAETCIILGKDAAEIILEQMRGYAVEGYPLNNGLIDSACLVRAHGDEQLQKVMKCWWQEVREKSRRDQLSIGYACWKNSFHYDLTDLFIYDNAYICKRRDREANY